METLIDKKKLKQLFKEALIEVLEERKDLLFEVLTEVIENIALVQAIREGEDTVSVTKEEILQK